MVGMYRGTYNSFHETQRVIVLEKIISGGQTGADRAALDVAIELGIPHGGWLPKGRKSEAGRLPARLAPQIERTM